MAHPIPGAPELKWDDWQLNAIEWMVPKARCGLGAEAGLGKTPVLLEMMERVNPPSCLIVVTKRAMVGWLRMMRDWYPDFHKKFAVILSKKKETRAELWKSDFIITTVDWYRIDHTTFAKRRNYGMGIFDEPHRYFRDRGSKTFEYTCKYRFERIHFLTGSAWSGKPPQLWTYFHLMDRKLYGSYWKWVNMFCYVFDGPFGKIVEGVKNPDSLQALLRQKFLLVTRKDLGTVRKRRMFLDTVMTEPQKRAYDSFVKDMIYFKADGSIAAVQHMANLALKLRQVLICPAIIDPAAGMGGNVEAIVDDLLELDPKDRHCYIVTPFREAVDLMTVHLIAKGVNPNVFKFYGGITVEELAKRMELVTKTRGIAIGTTQYAESFDLSTIERTYFNGYDYDPTVNRQAENRTDRRNNPAEFLTIKYCRTVGTYDEEMLDGLIYRQANMQLIGNDPIKFRQILRLAQESAFANA